MGETRQERIARLQNTILGYRADGRPIYPIAGGSSDPENDGDTPGSGEGSGEETPDSDGEGREGQSGGETGGSGSRSIESLPDWAQAEIRAARRGEGDKRTRLRAVEKERDEYKSLLDKLRAVFDPNGGEDTDPAKLAEKAAKERDEKDAALREKTIELAVYRTAGRLGGDADALLDSRSFQQLAGKLDPASETFASDLEAVIREAVEKNPKLRAAQGAPRSGSEFTGGSGGPSPSNKPRTGDIGAWRKYLRGGD